MHNYLSCSQKGYRFNFFVSLYISLIKIYWDSFILIRIMKAKTQSHQFPAYMSEYYKEKN